MALNRYKLRHLAESGHRGALKAAKLLERPDRLIGLILLGNNLVNIIAASIATIIGFKLFGEKGIFLATVLLTLVILIFAEVAPKTLAALKPELIAFPAAWVLSPLLSALYPVVRVVNMISNGLLRLVGVSSSSKPDEHLSREELRMIVRGAGTLNPQRHQKMLLNILDLERATVEDIMVPKQEIVGIDLNDDWDEIYKQVNNSQHTRITVYRDNIDNIVGFLHVRNVLNLLSQDRLDRESLESVVHEAYFIPVNTPLNKQLLNFQREKHRSALAIDEYGDIQGLVTLEDILEEIVGEFTSDPYALHKDIFPQEDGIFLVNASIHIRELNKTLGINLPTTGPKTLNGLILEYMENIPEPGTSLMIAGQAMDIVQRQENAVKTIRIQPGLGKDTKGQIQAGQSEP